MFRILNGLMLVALSSITITAQTSTKQSIEGAWKVAAIVVTGTNASTVTNPQPGLLIFARKHYSMMWIPGDQPRSLFKASPPTNEEKIAAYDSFIANSGTYELTGDTLTLHPMVARSPNFMTGGQTATYTVRIEATTLSLTSSNPATPNANAGNPAPSAPAGPTNSTTLKLTRVE
ncbi:MAG TPA: lipocalin-like domain-containing protein [Pyrinomonadaceae bacterium]